MEIERGDTVVTPTGKIGEYTGNYCRKKIDLYIQTETGLLVCKDRDLIKTDSPLRVLLTEETDARYVIEHATKQGFEFIQSDLDPWLPNGLENIALWPDEKAITVNLTGNVASTVSIDDTRQWKGWLDFHASEECETCGGEGVVSIFEHVDGLHDGLHQKPCPDCSEDDDQQTWESPSPSDPAWLEAYKNEAESGRFDHHRLGLTGYNDLDLDLIDRIETLEAERDELRGQVDRLVDAIDRLPKYNRGQTIKLAVKPQIMEALHEIKDQILDGEGESQ